MEKNNPTPPAPSTTLAKVNRPWLPAAVARERLFQRLDALAERPCTWIGAPAGYGKTLLAASYVVTRRIPCLWYQLDEDDADPATFFYYLGVAATPHGAGPPLPLLTPAYQANLAAFTRRYAQALGQRLCAPFLLLFDNYHRLPPDAPLHGILAELLAQLPAGIRCLVTSRGEPPPALTRARLHGQLAVLDAEELRLTLPEAEGLAKMHTERRLSAAQVRSLHRQVQGWAAGLTLLLRRAQPVQAAPALATDALIFDYFAAEVLAQADPATQTFLLKTALLPTLTAAMAEQLTGGNEAETRLNDLVRRHYFTVRDHSAVPRYTYHDLFRAFLLSRGRATFSAQERAHDQRRAAAILEAAGDISAAIELWQALGDWTALSRVIQQHAESLLRQGRSQLVEAWLKSVPPTILNGSPWLLFWLGQCQLSHDPMAARTTLVRAYRRFKHADEATGLWLAWAAITETYILAHDNFRVAGGWLVEFERLRTRYPRFTAKTVAARVICGVFNLLMHARPDHPEFAHWERRIRKLVQSDCPPELYLVSLNNLLFHYLWNVGRRGKAAWALHHLRAAHAQAPQVEPVLQCALLCWEFCYQYWYEGDLQCCLALAETAWATAVEQGIHCFNSLALSNFVYAHLSDGRAAEGRAALARFAPLLHTFRPLEHAHYIQLSGWEAWLSGRLLEAEEILKQSLRITHRLFYQSHGFSLLAMAQVQTSLGKRAAALRHLTGMRFWIHATRSHVGAFLRALALAQFALAWGREARACNLLCRALALGRAEGYIFFPLFKPDDVARLCALALETNIEVEYVQTLIRKRGLLPDPSLAMPKRWPCPVKLHTLGGFALRVDEQPITFTRRAQHKPLELLKALIAGGGREVHQDYLADALWPEAEGDAAQQTLKTTLHRLRRLLGHSQALGIQDGRLSLDPRYCWVDMWHLERHLDAAVTPHRARDAASPQDWTALTHTLLAAYRGPFLDQDPEPWALQTRERLHDRYLRGLAALAAHWETQQDWTMAQACYARGLDVDSTWARGQQGLQRCQKRLNQPEQAVQIYRR
jgi:ATP/maltotriose-dependent transcriptional regulator MalT/DNA-binding SARP family transcriptional activator